MILKIARYRDKQKWWIYDDIRKISISEPYYHNGRCRELPQDSGWDALFFDAESICKCGLGERCEQCVEYYVLVCRLNSGEEYAIAFDTVAYLLNDNGKTIERIVANHEFSFPQGKRSVKDIKIKTKKELNTEKKQKAREFKL